MTAKLSLIVYIGRFSMPHNGHLQTAIDALGMADRLLILIGSADEAPNIRNPWTWQERAELFHRAIPDELKDRVIFDFHHNYIEKFRWELQIQQKVESCFDHINGIESNDVESIYVDRPIKLIGHLKDTSSSYLNDFPQWEYVSVPHFQNINATDIRYEYFINQKLPNVPQPIVGLLKGDIFSSWYKYIQAEYSFQKKHDDAWASAPYEVIFHTVDAVVIQQGHVLLIKRKNHPGKDCWAMPGGYINPKEDLVDSMIRELREETGLKVPEKVLKGSIVKVENINDPYRSTRGRIITDAYLIELNSVPDGLPKVRGMDDASKAQWIPLYKLKFMRAQMFEDHYQIITHLLGI